MPYIAFASFQSILEWSLSYSMHFKNSFIEAKLAYNRLHIKYKKLTYFHIHIHPWNHLHNKKYEHNMTLKMSLVTLCKPSLISFPSQSSPGSHWYAFMLSVTVDYIALSEISYGWNYTKCTLFCLAIFIQYNFQIHLCFGIYIYIYIYTHTHTHTYNYFFIAEE